MIRTLLHDPQTGETRRGDECLLSEWSERPRLWIWADFDNEEPPREQTYFRETFGLHPLAVADAQREHHPPKLELFDDYFLLLMNGYISITSHRLNEIMKVLTVVTVIFLPLALLAGIYGMNFENIPELKIKDAYFVLLGLMASIVVGLLLLFRKMRWI